MKRFCSRCRQWEGVECEHKWVEFPDECVCDPRDWDGPITPVCDKFVGLPGCPCLKCEHEEACHKKGEHENDK